MTVAMEKANRPCTADALAALRRVVAAPLPDDYVAFLQRNDGGTPGENVFKAGETEVCVRTFLSAKEVAAERAMLSERFPEHALPIAEAEGGNYILLRPGRTGGWRVHLWDHEEEGRVIEIAQSFQAFFHALRPFSPDEVQLDPKSVISAWIDPEFLKEQERQKNKK